jgi:hypothetical protein
LELTALEITYIAGGFSILGVFVGSLTTHFLSKDISRRNDFNQAARDFISAFQNELAMLRFESSTTYDVIKPARIKHAAAYYTFRRYLKGSELENFISAWRIYYVSTPPCKSEKETDQKYNDERTAIIERIEALFKFAKFK